MEIEIFPFLNIFTQNFLERIFFSLLVITSIIITFSKNLLISICLLIFFSLCTCTLYILMSAPDVAMTESAVGACITTIIALSAMMFFSDYYDSSISKFQFTKSSIFLTLFLASLLLYSINFMPIYGDFSAPVHNNVSSYYLANSGDEIGIRAVTTAILASYRGFDTLLETAVVLTAGLSIFMLLYKENILPNLESYNDIFLFLFTKIIIPIIAIFSFYIQLHGEVSPGGGFQAGAILASLLILYALVTSSNNLSQKFSFQWLKNAGTIGVLIYTLVGVFSIFMKGEFLDYSLLSKIAAEGEELGIFIIELGVGVTVFSVLTLIYLLFSQNK